MAQTWNKYKLPSGLYVVTGTHAFTTTGATVEIDSYLNNVVHAQFTPIKSSDPSEVELLYLQEALGNDGSVDVDDDGQVTVGRMVETGGTLTSGLAFSYVLIGY